MHPGRLLDHLPGRAVGTIRIIAGMITLVFLAGSLMPPRAEALTNKWTKKFDGRISRDDFGMDVAVDTKGNVYVAGSTQVGHTDHDIMLWKYSGKGKLLWKKKKAGAGGSGDQGFGVAVAPNNRAVYIIGFINRTGGVGDGGKDIWLRKYSRKGKKRWTRTFDGGGQDEGRGVAVDLDGNIYAVGSTYVIGQDHDIWVRKYTPEGDDEWTRTFDNSWHSADNGTDVAVGIDGFIYVAGTTVVNDFDFWLARYSSDGTRDWYRTHNVTAASTDIVRGVAAAGDGFIYVVGNSHPTTGWTDIRLVKYNSSGTVVTTMDYDGGSETHDEGASVAVGPGGVYVAGSTDEGKVYRDILVVCYDPSGGDPLWTRVISARQDNTDFGFGVTTGSNRTVYISGAMTQGLQGFNMWLRKYRD